MAKKARKKLEEAQQPAFEFPEFDEAGFVWKEYELATATIIAVLFAVAAGVFAWGFTLAGLPWFTGFPVGLGLSVVGLYVVQRLRPDSDLYTKGDWAGLFVLEFFGFLALWFVLVNL